MILELFIGLIAAALGYYFWEYFKIKQITKHFKGPNAYPFIGNLLAFPSDPIEIFKMFMIDFHKTYGKNVVLWGAGLDWSIDISDLRDVEVLLTSNKLIKKGVEYEYIKPWLGDGLLISSGQKWFQRRKIITPTFHFGILQQFVEIFEQQENILIDKLRQHVDGEEFNIQPYITLCALDIINETAMGVQVNAQNDPDSEYVKAVHDASSIIFDRVFSLIGQWSWLWSLTPLARKEAKSLKILHDFTQHVIRTRREKLIQSQTDLINDEFDNDFVKKEKPTFLELLLKSTNNGEPLSDQDIQEEVDTFMFEGHDTTTSGISFALHQLSQHPKIQEKVYQEIINVFGINFSVPMTYTSLQELKYMEMVIKESLRMHPSVPSIGRSLTEDTIIGGVSIPAGISISIAIYAIHHDEDNFPNPDIFDPERFSIENSEKRHPYSYIPFSAGSRNCIGQKYAMLEMKSALTKILMKYQLHAGQSKDEIRARADLVLRPADGVNLKISLR